MQTVDVQTADAQVDIADEPMADVAPDVVADVEAPLDVSAEVSASAEGLQWTVDGVAREPVIPSAKVTIDENARISMMLSAAASGGVESCLVQIRYLADTVIAAGTYPCNSDPRSPPLVIIQLGLPDGGIYNSEASSNCVIVLDKDVVEFGPVKGSFAGDIEQFNGDATIHVEGTFDFASSIR